MEKSKYNLAFMKKQWANNKYLYAMLLPVIAYFTVFKYIPYLGLTIAFQDYSPTHGILGSQFVGSDNFIQFFNSYYFVRIIKNTFLLNFYGLLVCFPAPIILALCLNEVRNTYFKRTVQTISYLPYFVSIVVLAGMTLSFLSSDGLINDILSVFGIQPQPFMREPKYFRSIYLATELWQHMGWGSIIYLAALAGIDPTMYEASEIDGANRIHNLVFITIPSILPTIVILLILRIGHMMGSDFQKVLLLYNSGIYETADIISTFVYRRGILELDFSYSAAVDLFNSVINFCLLVFANAFSKKFNETSLW